MVNCMVLDAKWKSKQWAKAMPETKTALPMPELALVFGVSDAKALGKAMGEYRDILNEALVKIRSWPGADKFVGDFQIPEPKSLKEREMSLYFYPLPEEWGVDAQVAPTAGLTATVAVLTVSKQYAERLLTRRPLKVEGGPLADGNRPLVAATYVDWAGIVDAVSPWVEYGMKIGLKRAPAEHASAGPRGRREASADGPGSPKCFRGATSATSLGKDGVLTTHSEAVLHDLEK